jgi:hypothetical protein
LREIVTNRYQKRGRNLEFKARVHQIPSIQFWVSSERSGSRQV